jgi:hypothetical protein
MREQAFARMEEAATEPERPAALDLADYPFTIDSRAALRAFAEGILRMQLAGAIPQVQVTMLHRSLRILEHSLPLVDPPGAESNAAAIAEFLALAPRIAEDLEDRSAEERENAAREVGGKRDAFLQATRKHVTFLNTTKQNMQRLHSPASW